MFRAKLFIVAILLAVASLANAEVGCDVGLYSKYVGAVGGVNGTYHEPAIQGNCTLSSQSGFYINGWVSQSTRNPGLSGTSTNEFDVTGGIDKKFNDTWSADLHVMYIDLANPRVLQGTNGDLANMGGTLRYQATSNTKMYANLEGYHGIGSLGFPGGWRAGFGVRTFVGPVVVDGTLFHNQNFFGHGQFVKVMLEPVKPIAKFAGGEVRPTLFIYRPLGEYRNAHDNHIVGAIHITF